MFVCWWVLISPVIANDWASQNWKLAVLSGNVTYYSNIFKYNIISELYGVKYLYTYKELCKCQVFVIFVPFTFRGRDTTPPPNFFWITNGFVPWTVKFSWKNCCFAIHLPTRSITPTARPVEGRRDHRKPSPALREYQRPQGTADVFGGRPQQKNYADLVLILKQRSSRLWNTISFSWIWNHRASSV